MWLYTDLLQALKGELLSSVLSTDETLISASAAPHCRGKGVGTKGRAVSSWGRCVRGVDAWMGGCVVVCA